MDLVFFGECLVEFLCCFPCGESCSGEVVLLEVVGVVDGSMVG